MNDYISRRQESGRRRRPLHLGRQGVAPDGAASRSGSFPTQRSFGLPRQHQSAEAMRHFEEQAAAKVLRWRRRFVNPGHNAFDALLKSLRQFSAV